MKRTENGHHALAAGTSRPLTLASGARLVLRPRGTCRAARPRPGTPRAARLGGARADFVASLGRKVSDARELLAALEDDPSSKPARDELRRRLHALGSGARLLRFEAMARSLQEALAVLDRGRAGRRAPRGKTSAFVAQVLDDLPALAWGEPPPARRPPAQRDRRGGARRRACLPIAVLVVGGEALADALTEEAVVRSRAFECERTGGRADRRSSSRAPTRPTSSSSTPTEPSAAELVEALLDDPLTEPVPIVVVGTFRTPGRGGALRRARRREDAREARHARTLIRAAPATRSSTRAKAARCG